MGVEVRHVGTSHLQRAVKSTTFNIGGLEGRLTKLVLNYYEANFLPSLMFTMPSLGSRNTWPEM